ncbi:MAG: diphthine--ammonia ligase [Bacteroidetes bacterium]|nr:diphthine--ammonia ligase [Bacteroidota bacterium]
MPAVFCWSGGKDSALCLYKILQQKEYEVRYLLTTVNKQFRRVSMHGVREELLDEQAKQIGIPLVKIYVNEGTNAEYEKKMEETLLRFKSEGIHHVIFGDIFLEDLRKYREDNLAKVGMKAVFPLWKQDTRKLLEEFLALKFKTVICCTNDAYLGEEWAGRIIDNEFLSSLPANADACGENGEYHTFCFNGPLFKNPINISAGEKIYKPLVIKTTDDCSLSASATKGFWFCELVTA